MLHHFTYRFSYMPRFACQSRFLVAVHRLVALSIAAVSIGGVTPSLVAARQMYEVVAILEGPECPEFHTPPAVPAAINEHNEVVGYYDNCGGSLRRAFYWSQETGVVTLSFPFATYTSRAYDISDNGWITGTIEIDDAFGTISFVMRPDGSGLQLLLPLPGQDHCWAEAVNDEQTVVGYSVGHGPLTAFAWTGSLPTSLAPDLGTRKSHAYDINSFGVICGAAGPSPPYISQAFLWDGLSVTDLGIVPGTKSGVAKALNNNGEVAIEGLISYPPDPVIYHSYFHSGGRLVPIVPPDPFSSVRADDLNDAGAIVGTAKIDSVNYGYVWSDGQFTVLADAIADVSVKYLNHAYGINDSGWIVATGEFEGTSTGTVGVVLRPVAAPGDLNGDGFVSGIDLAMLLASWGSGDPQADLDGDSFVGGMDLALLLGFWTT